MRTDEELLSDIAIRINKILDDAFIEMLRPLTNSEKQLDADMNALGYWWSPILKNWIKR